MNEIVFVIATDELGRGPMECVEPVIDGISLIDRVARVRHERDFGGLGPAATWLARWQDELRRGVERQQFLGCRCGDAGCSGVHGAVEITPEYVRWSHLTPTGPQYPDASVHGIGVFTFDRRRYVRALEHPITRKHPVRIKPDLEALAAATPADHLEWLYEMTLAFGRDLFSIHAPETTGDTVRRGLAAFDAADHPMTAETLRRWAHGRRFAQTGIDRIVDRVRELGPVAGD